MIPANARQGDFVTVSNEDNTYFGAIGKIKQLHPKTATVDIYGKEVEIPTSDLTMKARTGTGSHDAITQQIKERECDNLDADGYNALINFAIDSKDFDWAKELIDRRDAKKGRG